MCCVQISALIKNFKRKDQILTQSKPQDGRWYDVTGFWPTSAHDSLLPNDPVIFGLTLPRLSLSTPDLCEMLPIYVFQKYDSQIWFFRKNGGR
jgi:hypothetical protein